MIRRYGPYLIAFVLVSCAGPPARWARYAPLTTPRQEVGVAEVGGKIYVAGGFDVNGQGLRTVEAYNPRLDRWHPIRPLPLPLHHVAAAAVAERLYLVGGFEGSSFEIATDRVWEYRPDSDQWQLRRSMPTSRGGLAVAVLDDKIYAMGGYRAGQSVADFSVYHPVEDRWESLPPMPTRRDHLAAAASHGHLYAISGRTDGVNVSVVERFDPHRGVWAKAASIPTARSGTAAAVVEGLVYVFGGEGNPSRWRGVFGETEVYDPLKNRWRKDKPMPTSRHGIGASVYSGVIYIPGGATRQGLGASAVHEGLILGVSQ